MVTVTMKLNLCGYVNYFDMDLRESYQNFLSKIRMIHSDSSSDSSENSPPNYRIKYYDDENDPCVISNKLELSEAISVMLHNDWSYLRIHLSVDHDSNDIYTMNDQKPITRKNAKRYKKRFFFKQHIYEKNISFKMVNCRVCKNSSPALNGSILKCINCKHTLHRKCIQNIEDFCQAQKPKNNPKRKHGDLFFDETQSDDNETYESFKLRDPSPTKELNFQTDITENSTPLNDYLLVKVIGRGSYSKVFLAKSKFNDKYYAIKAIRKSLQLEEDMNWVYTEKFVFILAQKCPFLVSMHCSFQTDSRLFFVLEFVAGGDMMYFMQKIKKLSEDDSRFYASEILLALNYLHENNIIYRDLKLDNIMITMSGHIKLTDYGLCKKLSDNTERTTTFCGTPHYIAPEMLSGDDYGMSVDWWAYGVVLYEMMVGKNPFDIMVESQNINANPEDYIYQQIMETTIRYPRFLSIKATNLLKSLLVKDPTNRIGVSPSSSVDHIKQCSFFKSVDWVKILTLEVTPPKIHKFLERKSSKNTPTQDIKQMVVNFDNMFVDLSPKLTPEETDILNGIHQEQFNDFDSNYS